MTSLLDLWAAQKPRRVAKKRITHVRLMEMVRYDSVTGVFTNLVGGSGRPPVGNRAGCQGVRGYRRLDLDGRRYPEHHAVWFYIHGLWPQDLNLHIDHINGDRSDNRLVNLRLASDTENQRNRAVNKTNQHGLKGVGRHCDPNRKKPYFARIKIDYVSHHLGWFATPEEAHEAYCVAAEKHFGQFARTA